MSRSRRGAINQRALVIVLLFAVAAGSLVIFQTNIRRRLNEMDKPDYSSALIDMVAMSGSVRVEDLKLSRKEIRTINFAAIRCKNTFPKLNVTLNMENKFVPIEVEETTKLEFSMVMKAWDETDVTCWPRIVERDKLVPLMVRFLRQGEKEFKHYRKRPGSENDFKRLYI